MAEFDSDSATDDFFSELTADFFVELKDKNNDEVIDEIEIDD